MPGDLRDEPGDGTLWIDQGSKAFDDAVAAELDGADLDDRVATGIQSGRFQVKRDVDALCHGMRVSLLGGRYAADCRYARQESGLIIAGLAQTRERAGEKRAHLPALPR